MHPPHLRDLAVKWHADGVAFGDICRRLQLPRGTVSKWLYGERSRRPSVVRTCCRCADPPEFPPDPTAYSYLLGQYLGDGHIQTYARTYLLSIFCDVRYPGIIAEIDIAMRSCGAVTTRHRLTSGCVGVQNYSKHWPCLFPQAGPGRKHERLIDLEPWQREIITLHPGPFVRGLFHSDGCRTINTVRVNGRLYAYPRYFFSNESLNILTLCGEALGLLGVAWRLNRRNSLSVARKDAVATLDVHVGPKV